MVSQLRLTAIGMLGLYWLALFLGTHVPISLKGGSGNDKVLHFLGYAGLAFLMALGIGGRRPTWRTFVLVSVTAITYAGFDEFSQILVGRHCDFWDWVADCFGTGSGLFSYWGLLTVYHLFWGTSRPKAEAAA